MNKQEIFNTVAAHLMAQGRQSLAPDGRSCAYRGEGGTKCAIGCLIPDELYSPALEGAGASATTIVDVLCAAGLEVSIANRRYVGVKTSKGECYVNPDTSDFLRPLQLIHDAVPVELWGRELRLFADMHSLELPPCLA